MIFVKTLNGKILEDYQLNSQENLPFIMADIKGYWLREVLKLYWIDHMLQKISVDISYG